MNTDKITDIDADDETVTDRLENTTIDFKGQESSLGAVLQDVKTAHQDLDEYKQGSLKLAQELSEKADEADDKMLEAILTDMSDAAFAVYLRLNRGDLELRGDRDGEYAGLYAE